MSAQQNRGDELVEQILADGAGDGKAPNELLNECFDGYPLDNLVPLLRSDSDEVVRAGAFIVEELAVKSRSLMPEIMRLLGHRDRWVKSDMLDAVLLAATAQDGEAIARAIELVNDPDRDIAKHAFKLVARADREQLGAAAPHIADSGLSANLSWILNNEESVDDDAEVAAKIEDQDSLTRWVGCVAAVRRYLRNPGLLNTAAESSDEDLRAFAENEREWLEYMKRRKEKRRERAHRRNSGDRAP